MATSDEWHDQESWRYHKPLAHMKRWQILANLLNKAHYETTPNHNTSSELFQELELILTKPDSKQVTAALALALALARRTKCRVKLPFALPRAFII